MKRASHRHILTARFGVALVAGAFVLTSCTGDDTADPPQDQVEDADTDPDEQGSAAPDDPDAPPEVEHQLTIVLCDDRLCSFPTDEQIDDLQARLDADDDIVSSRFETPEEAYERFVEMVEDLADLTDAVDADTMPASFWVTLRPDADPAAVVERYEVLPGVDTVDWISEGGDTSLGDASEPDPVD